MGSYFGCNRAARALTPLTSRGPGRNNKSASMSSITRRFRTAATSDQPIRRARRSAASPGRSLGDENQVRVPAITLSGSIRG